MTGVLAGRTAAVTGGGRGIGAAIAAALAREGATVAVIDKDAEGAERTAAGLGGVAVAVAADLTDAEQAERAVQDVVDAVGAPDVFVNNAGILRAGDLTTSPVEDWDAQFAVNTRAAYLSVRAASRHMRERAAGGSIVVVTSNCADTPRMDLGAYCASKAATDMMARCLALELAGAGIRVNSLCPGSCDTELQREQWRRLGIGPERQIAGDPATFRTGIPMGRLTTPEDVADLAVVLASDATRFVTGQSWHVDGGQTLS
ncbi:2,3-dihydro-2,3-dihydroxybenzoate dehydrogenase [Pseudonocardia petroleophila]|uniref:SDR family NAD(P)-dependent oxidoreductase n=1 Tax=Pseudonocardia petroleophila TaxID=37331 RepID=UPI0021032BC8|nr:glucose 1-dehydrogenase [Pseudonocardia petroleophila]